MGRRLTKGEKIVVCGAGGMGREVLQAAALIRQGIKVGSGCMVSMGSVVLRDVPDGASLTGNPARRIS